MPPTTKYDLSALDFENITQVKKYLKVVSLIGQQYIIKTIVKVLKEDRTTDFIRINNDARCILIKDYWTLQKKVNDDLKIQVRDRAPPPYTLQGLRRKWCEYERNAISPNRMYLILTGLYIWIPCLRNDYIFTEKIEDNKIYLSQLSKNNRDKKMVIPLHWRLIPYADNLTLVVSMCKLSKNPNLSMLSRINTAFKTIYGNKIDNATLRRVYIDAHANSSTEFRIELAKQMNHSIDMSVGHYEHHQPEFKESFDINTLF